jgi:hypothetical protein
MAVATAELIRQAQHYTTAYKRMYEIEDEELLWAIFITHLTYLINNLNRE